MVALRIVAVPLDEDDVLADERARLSAWAPANGWTYIEYKDAFDLLARIVDLQSSAPRTIEELDISAHGNPFHCNGILLEDVSLIAESFRRIPGIHAATAVYLCGCNTGLDFEGECIARSFAEAFGGPVFGSRGYLSGTHAEHNEDCAAEIIVHGIVYHPYPDAIDAVGDDVWRRFG